MAIDLIQIAAVTPHHSIIRYSANLAPRVSVEYKRTFVFIKGLEEHVAYASRLGHLRQATGQDCDTSTDILYFATTSVDFGSRPWTIMLLEDDRLVGAVLLHEAVKYGIPLGYFFASDATGEDFVLAPVAERKETLRLCVNMMLQRNSSAVVFLGTKTDYSNADWGELKYGSAQAVVRYRLPIQRTQEETFREFGHRTKKNLRYYAAKARRAGTIFHSALNSEQTRKAVASLYPNSDYRVSDHRLAAILDALDHNKNSFYMGLQSATGEWLSLTMGWRQGGKICIFFLMHHAKYRKASLSTAMRSMMLSHEVEIGSVEFVVIGGSNEVMGRYCVPDIRYDLLLASPSWRLWLIMKLSRFFSERHSFRQFLGKLDMAGRNLED